jgi:uncharacterized protein YifN (PemK superfamily)
MLSKTNTGIADNIALQSIFQRALGSWAICQHVHQAKRDRLERSITCAVK